MSGSSAGADAAARAAAVGSESSVLVQAPAGSGKTTLLVQRYLKLLSRVDAPERILALTFTRRAAQEMRERVLKALRGARLGERPPHIHDTTWELACAAARHMSGNGLDVDAQPARLRIETIDAFNAWLAAQLPIAAGVSGLPTLKDPRPAYLEAARRSLSHVAEDEFGAAVERVLALDDQRWRSLLAMIANMLPSRDRWLPLLAGRLRAAAPLDAEQLGEVRRHFDEDLQLLVSRALKRAHGLLGAEKLDALAPLLAGAAQRGRVEGPQLAPWLEDRTVLRAEASDLERWRCLTRLVLKADGGLRSRVTKTEGFPPNCADKPRMQDLLLELGRQPLIGNALRDVHGLPDPCYGDAQWSRARDVAQVLVLAAAQLDTVFREQAAVDFPAVSLAALRALGSATAPTDLGLRLDYRLQHILVDEFQDTSSAQLQLLAQLTAGWQAGDGRSIFCVGDPMQSIYGFRQAEVRAFLDLAATGLGDVRFEVQRLECNFRSAAELVDWVNACFTRIMPERDDRDRGAIAFRPASAGQASTLQASSGQAGAGQRGAGSADGAGVQVRGFATREQEALAIAEIVAQATHDHPDWRIAILVRARPHARALAAALRARGVAFRAVEIESLQDRAVVRDIIMLTRALTHLGDRIAWLALLRAPWAGLSLADLLLLSRAPLPWEALFDTALIAQLSDAGRAGCERVRAALQPAFACRSSMPLSRWIEAAWLALGGPACVPLEGDLQLAAAAFGRLRELDAQGMPDAAELESRFEDLFADHGEPGAVEIMTIHKAKGLEFDMVLVPALERQVPANRGQLLLVHPFARPARDGMVLAARPPVGAVADKLFEFLRDQLKDAAALEAQRLLYVACTRAKRRLWLTAALQADAAIPKEFAPRAGSLLAVLWPVMAPEFQNGSASPAHAADPAADAPRGGPLWRLPAEWTPEQAVGPSAALPATGAASEEWPEFDWAGETARRVGSLVHAQLHTLDLARVDAEAMRRREPYFRRWLALHGVPGERLQEAAARVLAALLAVFRDARGRWILSSGYEDDFREYALSGHVQGEPVHAVFDRSFVDSGVRWVIDYKTSQHLGGALEEFLDREVVRYRPQMQRYAFLARQLGAQPVRLALYFPLMRAWREWPAA